MIKITVIIKDDKQGVNVNTVVEGKQATPEETMTGELVGMGMTVAKILNNAMANDNPAPMLELTRFFDKYGRDSNIIQPASQIIIPN